MIGRTCQEFVDQITAHFEFLFSDYQFELEHLEEASAGDRCLLVLQGPFRLRFLYGKGDVEVSVGRGDAPTTWEDKTDGARNWLQIWGVMRYVTGEPKLTSADLMEIGTRLSEMDTNEYLAEMANSLRLAVTGIAEFLGSQKFPEELKRFEAYFYA